MKRQTMLPAPEAGEPNHGFPTALTAEAALVQEIAALGEWLAAEGFDLRGDQAYADAVDHERLYWHYGYFIGLKHALAMLTSRGATVH
jgi:hypothetical protein